MRRAIQEDILRSQYITGLINESDFNDGLDNLINEDESQQLKDRAEDFLDSVLKAVINKIPGELEKLKGSKGLNEYVEDEQVGGRGRAFGMFVAECEYGDSPEQIAEAIKDWAGNYMMGLNEPDFQGVSDAMTPEIYRLVKKCAPSSFVKEMKESILGESDKGSIDEIGSMAASTALSVSDITKAASKALALVNDELDPKYINRVAYVFEEFGHQWYNVYRKTIEEIIKNHISRDGENDLVEIAKDVYSSIIGLMAVSVGVAVDSLAKEKGVNSVDELDSSELLEILLSINIEVISDKIINALPLILDRF